MLKRAIRSITPRKLWAQLVHTRGFIEGAFHKERTMAKAYGWNAYVRLRVKPTWISRFTHPLDQVKLPGYPWPLYYRPGTSDQYVIRQVFALNEYACVLSQPNIQTIIDCGANIGCTTFFFLHHFPNACAVVVEPDPENMLVCRKNLAPYENRVKFVQSGVWSSCVPLVIKKGEFRDGAEWSIRVRMAAPGEPSDLTAVTVPELLAVGGFPHVDILKVDIEGAETEVFNAGAAEWLGKVRHLAIETHGPECEQAVSVALADYRFARSRSGELDFYRDITLANSIDN